MQHSTPKPSVQPSSYPKLDNKQLGHLRHFHNLLAQPDGEWHHFGSMDPHNEFDDAARYQLAMMTYAMGVAHYHRLPALRGPFKALMRRAIHKMMHPFVWDYWYNTSQASVLFDPDMKELRRPWGNPVVKENIMYSGHLLLMTSLYAMLSDDDEFEKEGSLTFKWRHWAWGFGDEDFVYDNRKLQQVILKQMEENEWVGVCCEPNAVFVVCNQYPLIATRYNDVRDGADTIPGILEKYKAAISNAGMINGDNLYTSFFALKQKKAVPARQGTHTAWANTFMNAWDSEGVRARVDQQTVGFLTAFDGKTRLQPGRVAIAFRKLVAEHGDDPDDAHTLEKARNPDLHVVPKAIPFESLNWGAFTMMLSELGKTKELDDLLEYADEYLRPTWENGGLFYPRNDQLVDKDWNLTHVEPMSGNSGIAYSRLNVEDGQKKMWEYPWTQEVLAKRPWLDGVTFADGVDFSRGIWDEEKEVFVATMRLYKSPSRELSVVIRNLPDGQWNVFVHGGLRAAHSLTSGGSLELVIAVGEREMDLIIERSR